jgi:hypothetical protein
MVTGTVMLNLFSPTDTQLMGWSAAFTQVGYKRRRKEASHPISHPIISWLPTIREVTVRMR